MKYLITVADMANDTPEDSLIFHSHRVAIVESLADVPQAIADYHMSGRCADTCCDPEALPHAVTPKPVWFSPNPESYCYDYEALARDLTLMVNNGILCYYAHDLERYPDDGYHEELYAIRLCTDPW